MFRNVNEKEMLNEISKIFKDNEAIVNIDKEMYNIEKQINNMDKMDKNALINNFFDSIKRIKFISNIDFSLDPSYYNENIILIGVLYIKQFENDLGEYDEKPKTILKNIVPH